MMPWEDAWKKGDVLESFDRQAPVEWQGTFPPHTM